MRLIDGPAINTDVVGVALFLLLLLPSIVVWTTEGLSLAEPEQHLISLMRDDVVSNAGFHHDAFL
jgi:hypothetical protein